MFNNEDKKNSLYENDDLSPSDKSNLIDELDESSQYAGKEDFNLFKNMINGFAYHKIILDDDGKPCDYEFIDINPAFEKIIGLKKINIVGKTIRNIFPGIEKDSIDWIGKYGDVALFGKSIEFESFSNTLEKYFRISAFSPLQNHFAVCFEDITEKHKHEENLIDSNKKLDAIFNTTFHFVGLLDLNGNLIKANENSLEFIGASLGDVKGKPFWETPWFNYSIESKENLKKIISLAADGEIVNDIVKNKSFSGELSLIDFSAKPIFSKNDHSIQYILVEGRDITEATQTKDNLLKIKKDFEALVENSSDIVMRFDRQLRHVYTNDAVKKLLGMDPKTFLGKTHSELNFPEDKSTFFEKSITECFETRQPVRKEFTLEIEGVIKHFDWKLIPEFNSDDKGVKTVLSTARDMSDWVSAKSELKNQSKFLEGVIQGLPSALFWKDVDGKYLGCNNNFANLAGKSPEELIGNTDYVQPWKMHADFYTACDEKVMVTGEAMENVEEQIINTDGQIFEILTNKVPLFNESNEVIGIMGVFTDITKLKKAKINLENSESRFRNLFNNMSNGVSIFETKDNGSHFIFKDFNEAAEIIEGLSKVEVLGKEISSIFPGIEDFGLLDVFKRVYKTGVPEFHPISYYKDGRIEGWRYNYVYRIPSMEIVTVYDDVTEQKESEEKLRDSIKEKEILLKEVHHRVKNNLQIISSLFSLTSSKVENENDRRVFMESQNRIKSIALIHETIYGTSDLANVDFQKYTTDLVSNLLGTFGILPGQIHPKIDVTEAEFDIDVAIPCGMIINELITNSLKHAFSYGEKGEVKVNLNVKNNFYILEVSDDGKGLSKDFDIYDTDSLGLQIVATLVNQLSGVLDINGDNGTKYTIKFKKK